MVNCKILWNFPTNDDDDKFLYIHTFIHSYGLIHILQSSVGTPKKTASFDLKNAAMGAIVAASLASGIATTPASAIDYQLGSFGSTTVVAEKVIREGLYREYEVELPDQQQLDDAQSTFKSAKETKSKKGTQV
jgi:hypothetical protein